MFKREPFAEADIHLSSILKSFPFKSVKNQCAKRPTFLFISDMTSFMVVGQCGGYVFNFIANVLRIVHDEANVHHLHTGNCWTRRSGKKIMSEF